MRHYRINDQNPIKTKRLLLTPLNEKELAAEEAKENDELLRGGLAEMRRNMIESFDQALWNTAWRISLKADGTSVGLIGFHGAPTNKTVELGYNIFIPYRGNGYAQEAIQALCNWAFGSTEAYFVSALADEDDGASNHILEKLKFYRVESPVSGMIAWELERPASAWISIYLCVGLGLGLALGSNIFGDQISGMIIGLAAGLTLGATMDAQDRAARKRENPPKKISTTSEKPQG